jgi:hypothetical protein
MFILLRPDRPASDSDCRFDGALDGRVQGFFVRDPSVVRVVQIEAVELVRVAVRDQPIVVVHLDGVLPVDDPIQPPRPVRTTARTRLSHQADVPTTDHQAVPVHDRAPRSGRYRTF